MKLVHELDVPDYETMDERDPMCPALWRYRKKITIEHLSSKFQEYSQGCDQQNKCEVLAEFLKKVLWKLCRIQRNFFLADTPPLLLSSKREFGATFN